MSNVIAYRPKTIESAGTRLERESATEKGYAEGLVTARAQAADELAEHRRRLEIEFTERRAALENSYREAIDTVEHAARALHADLAEKVGAANTRVQDAALEIAESVIGAEMTEVSSRARSAISRVLAQVEFTQITEIRMHPADITAVQGMPDLPQVNLVADLSLRHGDAFATLQDGWLDARISETLVRVRAALAEEHADEDALAEVTP